MSINNYLNLNNYHYEAFVTVTCLKNHFSNYRLLHKETQNSDLTYRTLLYRSRVIQEKHIQHSSLKNRDPTQVSSQGHVVLICCMTHMKQTERVYL